MRGSSTIWLAAFLISQCAGLSLHHRSFHLRERRSRDCQLKTPSRKRCYSNLLFMNTRVDDVVLEEPESNSSKSDEEDIKFDLSLAVILAGYSFEAYNEQSILGKVAYGLDGTNVTFTSSEYVQRAFSGALVVTLRQGNFKGKEEGFLETLLTGSEPDPYIVVSVLENENSLPPETFAAKLMRTFQGQKEPAQLKSSKGSFARVLDSAKSAQKDNSASPTWDESFYLYVKDPSSAALSFRAMDKDLFKEDDLLGLGAISVKEMQEMSAEGGVIDGVPVPLYIDPEKEKERALVKEREKVKGGQKRDKEASNKAASSNAWPSIFNLENLFGRRKLKRTGTLKVDVQFIPWLKAPSDSLTSTFSNDRTPVLDFTLSKDGVSQDLARDLELKFRRLPTGASPGLLDWAELTSTLADLSTVAVDNKVSRAKGLGVEKSGGGGDVGATDGTKSSAVEVEVEVEVKTSQVSSDSPPISSISQQDNVSDRVQRILDLETFKRHHRISNGIVDGSHYSQICSLDNADTDTQACVWADFEDKVVIVSFRGTEQIKFKDILTDINMLQVPYEEGSDVLSDINVHQGFMEAFKSVRAALLQVLHSLLILPTDQLEPDQEKARVTNDWHIYVTGHSLGGALATLFTFELGRMRAGHWGVSEEENSVSLSGHPTDPAAAYRDDLDFLSALQTSDLTMYSYGAPRCGCPAFSKMFDELISDSYRVVNNKDIVPRIPRSSKTNRFLQYEHVGRTVMISEDSGSQDSDPKSLPIVLWVQGEGDTSVPCPIADLSPFMESTIPMSALSLPSASTPIDPSSLANEAMGLLGQGVTDIASQLSGRFEETQQQLQKNLLTQLQNTVGADALSAASDTTSSASKLLSSGLDMMSQQYNDSDLSKSLSESFAALNPFKPTAKPENSPPVPVSRSYPAQGAGEKKKGTESSIEALPSQLISMALQATGLSEDDLLQLMKVGEAMSGMTSMATDITKGLTSEFIEREMELLTAIMDGKAVEHHLEPSYYKALSAVVDIHRDGETDRETRLS